MALRRLSLTLTELPVCKPAQENFFRQKWNHLTGNE
jgi:hypothetical protein